VGCASADEAGLPAFDILGWNALVVPSNAPKEMSEAERRVEGRAERSGNAKED
jgi:hypothetical protein